MRDRFPLLLIGGLLLLGFLGSFLFRSASRGSFADTLSTYRSEPDGARGLYLLAEEAGLSVNRSQQDLILIPERQNLALLAVEVRDEPFDPKGGQSLFFPGDAGTPAPTPDEDEDEEKLHQGMNVLHTSTVKKEETEALLEHIRGGATVLYVAWGHRENPLLEALDVYLYKADRELEIRTLVPAQPTPYTLGVERVETRVQSFLDLPDSAVPLLIDEALEQVAAAVVPYGQGQVVVIGAPELAMNKALLRADNARFWLSMLRTASGTGPLAFDEYHHGFTSERSLGEFGRRYGLHFAGAQLLLGLCLWAAALRRFGRPRAPPEEARVGSTEALFAASRLYREGKHHAFAANLIVKGVAQEFAGHAGLPWKATPEEISAGLRASGRDDLANALQTVISAGASVTTDADLERVAREGALARSHVRIKRRAAADLPPRNP